MRKTSRLFSGLIALLCAPLVVAEPSNTPSLVINGGYERGLMGWSTPFGRVVTAERGGRCLEIRRGSAVQDVYVSRGVRTFTVAVDIKTSGVVAPRGPGYVFAAVYQLDSRGEYVAFYDFAQLTGDHGWHRRTYTFKQHPQAEIVSLRCGLYNAVGAAWFDNWTLVEGSEAKRFDEVSEPGRRSGRAKGVAAIFREPGFPFQGAASSPEKLAEILNEVGVETHFLDAAALSDRAQLRAGLYDLVVLPYGASFPASARETMIRFLHGGGGFISMGGYAFNDLLLREGGRWLPEAQVLRRRLAAAMKQRNLLFDGGFEKKETEAAPVGGRDLDGRWHRSSLRCRLTEKKSGGGAALRPRGRSSPGHGGRDQVGPAAAGATGTSVSRHRLDQDARGGGTRLRLPGHLPVRQERQAASPHGLRPRARRQRLETVPVRLHAGARGRRALLQVRLVPRPRDGLVR
jgi:hypothetical protein